MILKKDGLLWKIAFGWRNIELVATQTDLCRFVWQLLGGICVWGIRILFCLVVLGLSTVIAVFFGNRVSFAKEGPFVPYPLPRVKGVRILPIYPIGLLWLVFSVYWTISTGQSSLDKNSSWLNGFTSVTLDGLALGAAIVLLAGIAYLIHLCGSALSASLNHLKEKIKNSEMIKVVKARIQSFKDGTCVHIKFE
jgi:hypothetical protein